GSDGALRRLELFRGRWANPQDGYVEADLLTSEGVIQVQVYHVRSDIEHLQYQERARVVLHLETIPRRHVLGKFPPVHLDNRVSLATTERLFGPEHDGFAVTGGKPFDGSLDGWQKLPSPDHDLQAAF